MQLAQSKTLNNLAAAFAGESQARNRYLFYAEQARNEKLYTLARQIEEIAQNELAHAKVFYDHIIKGAPECGDNITVQGDYPYHQGSTQDNLMHSMEAELDEHLNIYPGFAQVAQEEGFTGIAASFTEIAKIEEQHANIYRQLYEQVKEGSLYKKAVPTTWRCQNCGYMHTGTEAWKVCPVCQHDQGFVEVKVSTGGN
nr:ferritin family protein [Maliibacterium massiliense]